jgi:hypothetical protein
LRYLRADRNKSEFLTHRVHEASDDDRDNSGDPESAEIVSASEAEMEDSETDVSDEYCTCTTLMMKRNTN